MASLGWSAGIERVAAGLLAQAAVFDGGLPGAAPLPRAALDRLAGLARVTPGPGRDAPTG
jgi:hypothetical protein